MYLHSSMNHSQNFLKIDHRNRLVPKASSYACQLNQKVYIHSPENCFMGIERNRKEYVFNKNWNRAWKFKMLGASLHKS